MISILDFTSPDNLFFCLLSKLQSHEMKAVKKLEKSVKKMENDIAQLKNNLGSFMYVYQSLTQTLEEKIKQLG